jgi:TetR/AcrR family transcriptional regulator
LIEERSRHATGDTRERILEVATDEFAAKGFAGARVEEIARGAQVNKQLLYYYFGSKQALYDEVLGHMLEESRQVRAAESELRTLREKFAHLARVTEGGYAARWHRLLGWEALEVGSGEFEREDERRVSWLRHIGTVRTAQESGEVDAAFDPELLALALVSVVIFPYVLPQVTKFVTGLLPTDPGFRLRHEVVVEQLAAHLGAPSDKVSQGTEEPGS